MPQLSFEQCNIEEICTSVGGSKKLLDELRGKLREWLKLQPHLPHDAEDERLDWFLLCTKLSLELAKQKLDAYYTIRRFIPEFFRNRDPCAPGMNNLHDVMQFVLLPKSNAGNDRTCIIRFISDDANIFRVEEVCRYLFMINEIQMVEGHNSGYNLILDLSMMSAGQLVGMTPSFIKKCDVSASAHAIRLKGIHILNAFSLVNSVVTMVKSILKPKLAKRIHVHANGNFEKFHQFVPKSVLPKEYGGTYSNMDDLDVLLRKKLESWRDWYLEQDNVLVDESLRPGPVVNGDSPFGFSGSFRKLDVD